MASQEEIMLFGHYSQDYYDGHMMDGNMGLIGLLFMLLILGSLIWTAVYIARLLSEQHRSNGPHRDPFDIARERYAKGEITRQELAEIKKELK